MVRFISLLVAVAIIGAAIILLAFPVRKVTAQHDHGPLEGWAQQQQVMPAARTRVGCESPTSNCSCCSGPDIVRTKFRVAKDRSDAWDWLNPATNRYERVPDDIIHWGAPTPTREGLMFVYQDKPRCFFPPQDGGG
jgi:hypothetical protein